MQKVPEIQTLAEFGRQLRAQREACGLSLEALAQAAGISKPYLAQVETGRTAGPPAEDKLQRLEAALEMAAGSLVELADWLRTPASVRAFVQARATVPRRGDGTIDLDAMMLRRPGAGAITPLSAGGLMQVPVINRVAAGTATEHSDLDYPVGVADAYIAAPAPDAAADPEGAAAFAGAFAARVWGDSMTPEFCEGDMVVVAPITPRDGDDCLVRLGEADSFATTLKRVTFERGAEGGVTAVRLTPLNSRHAERVVPAEQVTGIYPVVYKVTVVRKN